MQDSDIDGAAPTVVGEAMPRAAKVCIGIATRGRPDQLDAMLDNLRGQTIAPASVIICCSGPKDIGRAGQNGRFTVVYEKPGLARQRNAVLRNSPIDSDIIVFFDDDFYPHPTWLEHVCTAFAQDPTIACITGNVVADGILGPGLSRELALEHLAGTLPDDFTWVVEGYSPYGCNMAFRRSAIEGLSFDERLVLYGWLEDRDFGSAVERRGRLIKLGSAIGVHLGVKGGRVSGKRLGYSQVMNPVYMRRKNTMTTAQAFRQVVRNVTANVAKSIQPEPYIDRRGRLFGNLLAAADLMRRRLTPERAESL